MSRTIKPPGVATNELVWRAAAVLSCVMLVACVLLGLSGPDGQRRAVGVTAYLVYAASAAVGVTLGFLFGLPRSRAVDQASTQTGSQTPQQAPAISALTSHFLANSNLIKVSDWLTTIMIGLGLVNLGQAGPALGDLGKLLRGPLGNNDYSSAAGLAIILSSVLAGFILGYLWTTVRVRELLEETERGVRQ